VGGVVVVFTYSAVMAFPMVLVLSGGGGCRGGG